MSKVNQVCRERVGDFELVTLEEIQRPKNGFQVFKDYYWSLTSDGRVMLYVRGRNYYPQCNKNESIVQYINARDGRYKDCKTVFIDTAYVPPYYETQARKYVADEGDW